MGSCRIENKWNKSAPVDCIFVICLKRKKYTQRVYSASFIFKKMHLEHTNLVWQVRIPAAMNCPQVLYPKQTPDEIESSLK